MKLRTRRLWIFVAAALLLAAGGGTWQRFQTSRHPMDAAMPPRPSAPTNAHPSLLLVAAPNAAALPDGVQAVAWRTDEQAFVVSATPDACEAMRRRDYGASVRPLPSHAKFSPLLAEAIETANGDVLRITAVSCTGDDANALQAALEAVGARDIRLSASSPRRAIATADLAVTRAAEALAALAASEAIQWLEPAPTRILFNDRAQAADRLATAALKSSLELSGAGQIVAVADTGLDSGDVATLHPDFAGRLADAVPLGRTDDWSDLDGHGTHVAASLLGTGAASDGRYVGVAPGATLFFQSVANARGALSGLPDDLCELFDDEYAAGARISSHSWGTALRSTYNVDSLAVDEFVHEHPDFLVLFAAGNDGDTLAGGRFRSGTIATPATAKNILAIGASESGREPGEGGHAAQTYAEAFSFVDEPIASDLVSTPPSNAPAPQGLAAFSGRGPAADRRIKPDVVAPGTDVLSAHSRASGTNYAEFVFADNPDYLFLSGTSMATPLAAGCATLLREHLCGAYGLRSPSAALLRAALVGGARSLAPGQYPPGWAQEIPDGPRPNQAEGWGQLDLAATLAPDAPAAVLYLDAPLEPFASADDAPHACAFDVADGSVPLTVALAYSDAPPSLASPARLVNDLDLTLVAPDGTAYLPSLADAPDRLNVLETVDLPAPVATGRWTAVVSAHAVPVPPQSYALYVRAGAVAPAPAEFLHEPLADTCANDVPYPVHAAFDSPWLSTHRDLFLDYVADRAGHTADAARLLMDTADRVRFDAAIPAQPVGTVVTYTFASAAASDAAFPIHAFRVCPPVAVRIAVEPERLAAAHPDLFPADPIAVATGATYVASAPQTLPDPDAPATARYLLVDPPDGTNVAVAALAPTTLVTFAYARQTSLLQTTDPEGLLHTTTWHTVAADAAQPTLADAVPVPLRATLDDTAYAFAGWTLDGAVLPAPAANPLRDIDLSAPRHLVARYLPADLDADADALTDAFELRHFGLLGQNPYADPDADGYANALEDADGTDPLDPASVPKPPAVDIAPVATPYGGPFPLPVDIRATDNCAVATVTLAYSRRPARAAAPVVRLLQAAPDPDDPTLWRATLPLPVADADHIELVATATDLAGLAAQSATVAFDLALPVLPDAPAVDPVRIDAPAGVPPIEVPVAFSNAGTAPLRITAQLLPVGFATDCENGPDGITHDARHPWHIDTLESASPTHAWYNGFGDYNPTYPHSADAPLLLPPVLAYPDPAEPPVLAFRHLAEFELDTNTPTVPPHYWDSAVLEHSTDAGATWLPLVPDGGYPALVTSNTASPFPPDTPCLASTGGLWQDLRAPIPYPSSAAPELHVRFRFGSDAYETARGWFLDDISIAPRTAYALPPATNWCALSDAEFLVPPAASATLLLVFDPALLPPSATDYQLLRLTHTAPSLPSPIDIPLRLRNTLLAFASTADGPGLVDPAYPPDAPLLLPPDALPATIHLTFAPDDGALLADLSENGVPVPDLPAPPATPAPLDYAIPAGATTNIRLHATFTPAPPADAIPPDAWFRQHGFPTNRPADALAALDSDSDGLRNWQEYDLGLDPFRPDACLRLLAPPPYATWHALTNEDATYVLQSTTNLSTTPFADLYALPAAPPLMTSPPIPPAPALFLRLLLR